MEWLLNTILRKLQAVEDTVNYTAREVDRAIRLINKHDAPSMTLVASFVIDAQGVPHNMSQTNQIVLVNAADPSVSTRYFAEQDILNGTTAPTVTSSDPTKLVIVTDPAGVTNGKFVWAGYPIDTSAETNDAVTATVSLPGAPDIVLSFLISGQPVPPQETDALDPSSAVGAWANAPAVPASPV